MRSILTIASILFCLGGYAQVTTYSNPLIKGCAAYGTDSASVRKYLDYCKANSIEAYFPAGTYQFPENWDYDYGAVALKMRGDGIGKTIFTCTASPLKYTERINLSLPKTQADGYYIADVVPATLHSNWSALSGIAPHDYFKIVSGTPSLTTRSVAVAAGYVAELSNNEGTTDPGTDGLYVINQIDFVWGGGFTHDTLEQDGDIYVTIGSVVERAAGVWSRYNPVRGFRTSSSFEVTGISFRNLPFFLFDLYGTTGEKTFKLVNCEFDNITRVITREASSEVDGTGPIYKGSITKPGGSSSATFAGWSWDSYEISNCQFINILSAINWWTSYAKKIIIKDNTVRDCYTLISYFHLYIENQQESDVDFSGNSFIDCRNYSSSYGINVEFLKSHGGLKAYSNTFLRTKGLHIFAAGNNNIISHNTFDLFNEMNNAAGGVQHAIFFKNANSCTSCGTGDLFEGNFFTGGGSVDYVGLRKNNKLTGVNNVFMHSVGNRSLTSTDSMISRGLIYTVTDTTRFKEIIGSGQYVTPLVDNGVYMYDYNLARWDTITIPPGANKYCLFWEPDKSNNQGIYMMGNVINTKHYFVSTTSLYTLSNLYISDEFERVSTMFVGAEDVTNIFLNVRGAGVPSLNASPGSIYRRTDGGVSTSLYIKETTKTDTTWEAK